MLILIVLVQNSKGGGLSSGFASNNQYMGVRKTSDFLEKLTSPNQAFIYASSPRSSSATEGAATGVESATKKRASAAPSAPATPSPAPANQAPAK